MTDPRDASEPNGRPDSIGLPSIMRSDETVLSPGQPARGQLPALGLPNYEFIREIHRGGQGVVYLALQCSTQRHVAIKVMREGPFAGPDDRSRFDREVRILAHLKHPSIVAIHDSGAAAGCDYFVMDYIEGKPLDEYLKAHPLNLPDLVELFRRICEAVQSAHDLGVVHRDLKPGNIRVDDNGVPYILDFGLAKAPGSAFEAGQMTQSGLFIGSLPWASPEQAEGHASRIDTRTDVYSLGVIFYNALTGHPPYNVSGSVSDAIHQIINATPARPTIFRREIESDLETIVLKCLQKEPHRRYANAGELAADLAAYEVGSPIMARRDSSIYLARKRANKWLRANRSLAFTAIAPLVGVFVVFAIGAPLIYSNAVDRHFRRIAMPFCPPLTSESALKNVRVLLMTDRTDISAIASREGLSGVSSAVPKSLRRLHGRLMERLAAVRPRSVVFDISFRGATEFDADMLAGILALKDVNAAVTVAVKSWDLDDNGLPDVSPALIDHVRWGSLICDCPPDSAWAIEPVMYRTGFEPRPSLDLAAFASFRQPRAQASLAVDAEAVQVQLNYWQTRNQTSNTRQWLNASDAVQLTSVQVQHKPSEKGDLKPGDILGILAFALPGQSVLDASTIEYGDVFSAPLSRLAEWFEGRAIVIGNGMTDRVHYFDGRSIPGTYSHAVALESMLESRAIRLPRDFCLTVIAIIGGIIGTALGIPVGRPLLGPARITIYVAILFAALALFAFVGSLIIFRTTWYLINPLVPLVSAWAAAGLSIVARRNISPRTEFRPLSGVVSL